jgi:NAD(P)-dependent dehydrogenase (short-subunit alcohol dehydrogenase family)
MSEPLQLSGKVAVVTGGSRGVGKGIALGLGEAGATVYVTGRSLAPGDDPRGSLSRTVDEIAALGGQGIAVRCDHTDDSDVKSMFERVRTEQGRLDVLVNNVMSTPQRAELPPGARSQWDLHPFWEMPLSVWDAFHLVGLRSHYVASVFAAPLLIEHRGGLIVCISAPGSRRYVQNVAYGVGKAGVEKLAADMAEELRPYRVASVSLWPGFVRTEDVVGQPAVYPDLSTTVSQIFPGRAIAALAADPAVMGRTGETLKAADLAEEYGFNDVEPSGLAQPPP